MPLPRDKDHIDTEALNEVLMSARVADQKLATAYKDRMEEVSKLEDLIIEELHSAPNLSVDPSLLDCMAVQNAGQAILNRLTPIELKSIRILRKLSGHRKTITDAILDVLGASGSAESRRAKADRCLATINLLINNEEGLQDICKTARANIVKGIDGASRSQTAIQNEIEHLGGAQLHADMINALRGTQKLK